MAFTLAELPLALFSTLAPLGAGAFLILAILFSTATPDNETLRRIDRLTAIPAALVIVGFIAAFFHLANPMHAFGVFANLGSSPLSNEIAAGCVFTAVMLVYWFWALTGKMPRNARKGLSWAVAALGLLFAWFTGMAYMIDTIPSWNTLASPIQTLGFALAGGTTVAILMLALAKCDALKAGATRTAILTVLAAGLVLGIGGLVFQLALVGSLENPLLNGATLVGNAGLLATCGVICLVAMGVCDTFAVQGKGTGALVGVSTGAILLAIAGVLMLRLVFYVVQLSAGLSIM